MMQSWPVQIIKKIEIFTDASSKQIGAAIAQDNWPIAFFSRKLLEAQEHYNVTEIQLLATVETPKEFNCMLWGQGIKVYIDNKKFDQGCPRVNP